MKSVLMVAYMYPPGAGSSGVLRPLKFSRFLPEFGWSPHVLTSRESLYEAVDQTLVAEIPPSARVHRTWALDASRHLAILRRYPSFLAVPDVYAAWLPFGVAAGFRVVRGSKIDAIFSTSPPATSHLIAGVLHRATRLPWIADFRDPWVEDGVHPRPGTIRQRVESSLERRVVSDATRITVTTPQLRGDFLHRYPALPAEKVEVLYNGYDETDFEGVSPEPSSERFEIVHAGLVTKEFRDPRPLLEAVSSLIREGHVDASCIRITFLGASGWLLSPEFAQSVEHLGMRQVVECAPFVAHRQALRRLSRAAVLLLLQASEDTRSLIPAKAFEYLRLGLPIIALSLDGATSDVLKGQAQCHVHDPADRPGLRQTLLGLYSTWKRAPRELIASRIAVKYDRRALTGALAAMLETVTC